MDPSEREKILNNIDYFVENTTNYEIVLQKLIEKDIISEPIRQAILRETTEENRTRCMYKLIPKRGPTAFKCLYDAFLECGLSDLAVRLQPRISVTSGPVEGEQPTLVHVVPASRRMDIDHTVYKMGSRPKGYMLLLIVDLKQYSCQYEQDERLLIDLWKGLGYKIIVRKGNFTKKAFNDEVVEFRNRAEHKNVDSCVIHILSPTHVNTNIYEAFDISCANGKVSSESIMDRFKTLNCFNLHSKPKLFFFHLYGFKHKTIAFDTSVFTPEDIPPVSTEFVSDHAHICSVNSLVIGSLPQSIFIQYMANIFAADAHNTDLDAMISKISRQTEPVYFEDLNGPIHICSDFRLSRRLYFHPGLYD